MVLRKTSLQMNFVCEVSGAEWRVNPDEHSEGVWARRGEVSGLEMTGEMRVFVEGVGFGLGIVKGGMGRGVGGVWDRRVHECYAVPPSPPADFTYYDPQVQIER